MIVGVNWPTELIPNVVVANTPQLLFSILYFTSNSILTNMTLAREWNTFSLSHRGLRVSTTCPQGSQRTTHFLSLPYRYGLPLLALSALLHWLISQSIFLVRVAAYHAWIERDTSADIMTVGYSPLAIVVTLIVSAILPGALIWFGCKRFCSGMPVAGACSLAIAAACHPWIKKEKEEYDTDHTDNDGKLEIEYRRLRWGVEAWKPGSGHVRHCAFSDADVREPLDGAVYR
jgi:hypothetical protein